MHALYRCIGQWITIGTKNVDIRDHRRGKLGKDERKARNSCKTDSEFIVFHANSHRILSVNLLVHI